MILIARTMDESSETCTIHRTRIKGIDSIANACHSADDFVEVEIGVLCLDDGSFEEFVHFE